MRRIGAAASLIFVAFMLGMYFATERGAFEMEPVGVTELRQQKDNNGKPTWLSGQVAWLKIDGTHIDYPVMQTDDNQWYLSHDYYGNSVASGAVFLDYRNAADFSDELSIIYGHRMNSDLMFSDVAKYCDADYFSAHIDGELITPEQSFRLRVLAYREVGDDDELYWNLSLADFNRPVIVLSTCDRGNHNRRDILILAFDNRGEIW
jgi:sortase B